MLEKLQVDQQLRFACVFHAVVVLLVNLTVKWDVRVLPVLRKT